MQLHNIGDLSLLQREVLGSLTLIAEGQPMTLTENLLLLVAECERMSKFSEDQTNKAAWLRMAERWKLCAKWERQHEREPEKQTRRQTADFSVRSH